MLPAPRPPYRPHAAPPQEEFRGLTTWWKGALGAAGAVESVKVSKRLSSTPCVVVSSKVGGGAGRVGGAAGRPGAGPGMPGCGSGTATSSFFRCRVPNLFCRCAACLLLQYGWSATMEKIARSQTLGDSEKSKWMRGQRTLEINPRHPLIIELKAQVCGGGAAEVASRGVGAVVGRGGCVQLGRVQCSGQWSASASAASAAAAAGSAGGAAAAEPP